MEWQVTAGLVGALGVVAAVAVLAGGRRGVGTERASIRPARTGRGGDRRPVIAGSGQPVPAGLGRRTLDGLRVGVVVLDADDNPVVVNPAARAMGLLRAGTTAGAVTAHPIIRTLAGQVRRSGARREIDLDLPRGRDGGAQEPLGVHLCALGMGDGFVSVEAADVTEAHRVDRVRRDFVANVSHELKTPIGALQLLAEALLDATEPAGAGPPGPLGSARAGLPAPPEPADSGLPGPSENVAAARRFAERIQHESTRLGRLVSELLELTRLQGAEPLPAPEPVSVDWVVAEVLDRTRTAASARRIEIVVAGQRGLTVYGSAAQVATAVTNLVENAIAYSGGQTRVTVVTGVDDDQARVAVTDQGIGIAPEDLDRIFERFYRADQARSRSTGGTGLGLAIVKHIATNHGGRVEVTSAPGAGSTFTLWLPARPAGAGTPPAAGNGADAARPRRT